MNSDSTSNRQWDCVETTIGELIETITAIALQSSESEEECYALATAAVNDMLTLRQRAFVLAQ